MIGGLCKATIRKFFGVQRWGVIAVGGQKDVGGKVGANTKVGEDLLSVHAFGGIESTAFVSTKNLSHCSFGPVGKPIRVLFLPDKFCNYVIASKHGALSFTQHCWITSPPCSIGEG